MVHSALELTSSDQRLVEGFAWAKSQALAYVFHDDPVGDWYEAALPGREAFCMRDVAHQSTGAQVLGLARHTHNMLEKFAENIAPQRDWCSYWEINRYNQPAPVDYDNDQDFWYNLPANFDILDCCYRQYLWTGDCRYLDDPVFRNFYSKSVNEYVQSWDRDGDGVPEHYPQYGRRGIATYNEEVAHPLVGGDLLATQFAAYRAYAQMLAWRGDTQAAAEFQQRAQQLQRLYDQDWWNEAAGVFASYRLQDGSFAVGVNGVTTYFPLYFGLVSDPRKAALALSAEIARRTQLNVEERSYLPELFYAYGEDEAAYSELLAQLDPHYARRQYPEVSFAVLGSLAVGLLGIQPDAITRRVTTRSHLTQQTAWIEMAHLPVFDSQITVKHIGKENTQLSNEGDSPLVWRAKFAGKHASLRVDGDLQAAHSHLAYTGQVESWVEVEVAPHSQRTVSI